MRDPEFVFRYRACNWRDDNHALVRRGSITFWVDEQAVRSWCAPRLPGARGRPQLYADTAIECALKAPHAVENVSCAGVAPGMILDHELLDRNSLY